MLGEQLIKDEQVALIELIKNCYDADATKVTVNFSASNEADEQSAPTRITITDNGQGMTERTLREDWLNPATPGKLERKRRNPRTDKGRIIQGEKGIGRFALFKLGSRVRVITRSEEVGSEYIIDYDLSFLDEAAETVSEDSYRQPRYLDEIEVKLIERLPEVFTGERQDGLGSTHGTQLVIEGLRSVWRDEDMRKSFIGVEGLQPIVLPESSGFQDGIGQSRYPDFEISFLKDGIPLPYQRERGEDLERLFADRAVFDVRGNFSDEKEEFTLDISGEKQLKQAVSLFDTVLEGLRPYRDYFIGGESAKGTKEAGAHPISGIACGSFEFRFFIFDLNAFPQSDYYLDLDERRQIKDHRVYLYRDGIRVLPYGDPTDDWLQLDVTRGTQGASRALSNDQIVGFVYISQRNNPSLQDKTNREGLLEMGRAASDLKVLIQCVIVYLRRGIYAQYLDDKKRIKEAADRKVEPAGAIIRKMEGSPDLPKVLKEEVRGLHAAYTLERKNNDVRIEQMETLAGVGLSVEMASHDIVSVAGRALRSARQLRCDCEKLLPGNNSLMTELDNLIESLSFVTSRLKDIQGLFVSTRQRRRPVPVGEYAEEVKRIYASVLNKRGIGVDIVEIDAPLTAKSTDAALLQVLINLFDNAAYWLDVAKVSRPKIKIIMDAPKKTLIFADNGPGVRPEDVPYIFEPFYSGKGEEGKGLGLYIARQVGARNGFTIRLIEDASERILPGANFVLDFSEGEKK